MAEKKQEYYEGIGRRKTASARVRIYPGGKKGVFTVNDKKLEEYFTEELATVARAPLGVSDIKEGMGVTVMVQGGGSAGQAGAVSHGIARALVKMDPELRMTMRSMGYLTRDPRMKERKKPGLLKARKKPQWGKR